MPTTDPFQLDRALARFAARGSSFEEALREGSAEEHIFEALPAELDDEEFERLREQNPADPMAEPFLRWAGYLRIKHACVSARRRQSAAFRDARHPLDTPARGNFSLRQMRDAALLDAGKRGAWLHALASHSTEYQDRTRALWDTENDARERLQLSPLIAAKDTARIVSAAKALLAATKDAYSELGLSSLAELIASGIGTDAPGVYPARLSPRSLADLFREGDWLAGLSLDEPRLPRFLGVSSFLRALALFGAALHDAAGHRGQPFALRRDPLALRSLCFGSLIALLPSQLTFDERRLDVAQKASADHQRSLSRVLLLGSRLAALRVILTAAVADGERAYRRAFSDVFAEGFGFELDPRLSHVLFADSGALPRFVGLLAAFERNHALREQCDEDWFRNPRAVGELRAEFEAPARVELDALDIERGFTLFLELLKERL
jgi:hypothetical protein